MKNNRLEIIKRHKYIIQDKSIVLRYSNCNNQLALSVYRTLSQQIGCTYLIYMYEDLNSNIKYVYSSNWDWQDILIGDRLINDCPVFLHAFQYLDSINCGQIFLPWCYAHPKNIQQRNVVGIREEHNIAHGFGYGAKGNGCRETLAFGGEKSDTSFYKHFLDVNGQNMFWNTLSSLRDAILLKDHQNTTFRN